MLLFYFINSKRNINKLFLYAKIGTRIWTSIIEVIQLKRKKNKRGELGKTKRIPFWEKEQNLMKEKTNGLAGETRSY